MSRRSTSWLAVGALVLLVVATLAVFRHLGGATAAGQRGATTTPTVSAQLALQEGVDLHGTPAPDFALSDQHGAALSLSQLRGHVVVLTFFDSLCPHADCSLMAQYLDATAGDLGAQKTAQVDWVALTVNPWHDTPASATAFLTSRQVNWPFHYLLGTPQQMAPIWNAYHMQAIEQPDGIVIHTTGVYVIDGQGRERLYMDEGFDPPVLSAYLQSLLKEPANAAVASGTPAAGQPQPANTFEQTQKAGDKTVALTAAPGQFGTYTFTATVQDSQGVPVQAAAVTANLMMPDMAMQPVSVKLAPMNPPVPGAYQAQGVLSMKGLWQVTVQVQTQGMAQPVRATFVFNAQY